MFSKKKAIKNYLELQKVLSDMYKASPEVRNMVVKRHYYMPSSRLHYYVVDECEGMLFGFKVSNLYYYNSSDFVYLSKPIQQWQNYDCNENLLVPRTLGEVFDEYDKE